MFKVLVEWFRDNWFLWVGIILIYILLRFLGYEIRIVNSKDPVGVLNQDKRIKIDW